MLTPQNLKNEEIPVIYKTYKIDLDNKRIVGMVDGYDSIVQSVIKTLLTERYAYEIYSSDIGVEFNKYIGQDFDYINTDLKHSIEDALSLDDRIINVSSINIVRTSIDSVSIDIVLDTIEGEITLKEEVNI